MILEYAFNGALDCKLRERGKFTESEAATVNLKLK
jgi:hypothetical protein